jgi:hypothetical protein
MLEIIEAPNQPKEDNKVKLFLAGGITNCRDWQKSIIEKFQSIKDDFDKYMIDQLSVFNPRREDFPIDDPNASEEQITWEYEKLKESDIIVYWFSSGSLNPIVLYELGLHGNSQPDKKIVIGCDKKYERISDVEIQTKLARPDVNITYDLDDFFDETIDAIYDVLKIKNEK